MFKKLFIISITLIIYAMLPVSINASEDFTTDSRTVYIIDESGDTKISHHTTVTNNTSGKYVKSYTFTLNGVSPINISASDDAGVIKTESVESEDSVVVNLIFDSAQVGKESSREFTLTYELRDVATKTGEVWEVVIPKLVESGEFRNFSVEIHVPNSFGEQSYVSPNFKSKSEAGNSDIYYFDKSGSEGSAITMGFGEFQVFSYSLKYHLENPLKKKSKTEIPIPPDTSFQKVYFDSITPEPESVYVDTDGNWIAIFNLGPRERVDVSVIGSVQLFSTPWREFGDSSVFTNNIKSTEYWQSNDPSILNISSNLDSPREIYDYVVETLGYDYERVKPNVERLGAVEALNNPDNAICMEFTDLFIALARAKGIPAREVNGFAYSENPQLQPLSLVADVLHSWPEYWDAELGHWVPVDPTWGSTTNGGNYFDKLDLRHFVFVHHGSDPSKPYPPGSYKLGPNPQKDVFVNFGRLPNVRESAVVINAKYDQGWPFSKGRLMVDIKNSGPVAIYSASSTVNFNGKSAHLEQHDVILPYSAVSYEVESRSDILGLSTPANASVSFNGKKVLVNTGKQNVVIYNLVVLFLILTVISLALLLKIKKVSVRSVVKNAFRKYKI